MFFCVYNVFSYPMSYDNLNSSTQYNQVYDYKNFLLTTQGVAEKSSKEYGLAVMKYIASTCSFRGSSYYAFRNARFLKNRNYANGRIDVEAMFRDRFLLNKKPNYISLNWTTLQLVNRIISSLVSRWMQRGEKIRVKAIDDLSQTDKKKEYDLLQVIIQFRNQLEQIQNESGIQVLPNNDELPEDKEALNIWQNYIQRLPEEIIQETTTNQILESNGWFTSLKERFLTDSAEVFLLCSYVYMDNKGIIHTRYVKPEDAVYSYTENSDMRDLSWKGEYSTITISQFRRQWGKEFNPDNPLALDEKEIYEKICPIANEWKSYSNMSWADSMYSSFLRPYDEWNIRVLQIEVKTVDTDKYTITKSKLTGSTYVEKGMPKTQSGKQRDKPLENQNIVGDTNWNIYRGVYVPEINLLVEWGIKTNMIRPQDPKEIGDAEYSYSFVMPQNYLGRNLAIPEKIEAAIDGMMLSLLKIQQVVARMRPTGAAIDETALQNVDYGLGDESNKVIDYKKLYDQTGDIYYRGVDAEGNRVPIPITELQNSGFLAQMNGLINNYQFWYNTLKDELGEDPNIMTAALQPRVTTSNVEVSQQSANNATDQYYRAYVELTKQTARKISCLIGDSIKYGSHAYRNIMGKDSLDNRVFSTEIRFLPTDEQVNKFEVLMNQVVLSNPDFLQFIDPFKLMRVAKEDEKLAELMFRQAQKKFILWQQQKAIENSQMTAQLQAQSAQVAEQESRKTMQEKMAMEANYQVLISKEKQKESLITGFMNVLSKGVSIPAEWKQVESELIKNVALPIFAENKQQTQMLASQQEEADQQSQQDQSAGGYGSPDDEQTYENEEQQEPQEMQLTN